MSVIGSSLEKKRTLILSGTGVPGVANRESESGKSGQEAGLWLLLDVSILVMGLVRGGDAGPEGQRQAQRKLPRQSSTETRLGT